MVVAQVRENHRQIEDLLAQLSGAAPAARAADAAFLKLWNERLKKYVSTDPVVGEAVLRRRIAEVRFDRTPLDQAIATLAAEVHADVVADWARSIQPGSIAAAPVSATLHDVTFAKRFSCFWMPTAGKLDFRVDGGSVVLGAPTTREGLTTRLYDIRDWIRSATGPPPAPAPRTVAQLTAWTGLRDPQVDRLVRVIEGTIDENSWQEQGGTFGRIDQLNGQLIVTQTWENQERVADLLAALRGDPAPPPCCACAAMRRLPVRGRDK